MSNRKKPTAGSEQVPRRRQAHGRHREPSRTVGELMAVPGQAGAKVLAAGALGSVAVMAMQAGPAATTATATTASPAAASLTAAVQPAPAAAPAPAPAVTAAPGSVPAPAPVPAAGAATNGPGVAAPTASATRPVVWVGILGDSYTSGEGNTPATFATNANGQIYPQHQSNMSPAMQALQQLIIANPQIDFRISNVAVSGATRPEALFNTGSAADGTQQAAQIDAVKNADIVINGFGGNDAGFGPWASSLMTVHDSSVPALWNGNPQDPSAPNYSQYFTSGQNLSDQVDLLRAIAENAKPGAVVVTVGYPQAFGDTAPAWDPSSPYTTSLGQNAATYSNLFGQNLNSDNRTAAQIIGTQNPNITSYFANLEGGLNGGQIGSGTPMLNYLMTTWDGIDPRTIHFDPGSLHPNPLGQTALGSAVLPALTQAVQDVGTRNGFTVNDPQAAMNTFAYQWNNRADVPMQVQANDQSRQTLQDLQQTTNQPQLAQQAQQGPKFDALGAPANEWTALTTQYPAPTTLPDGWTIPAPKTPTAFPDPSAATGPPPNAAPAPADPAGPAAPSGAPTDSGPAAPSGAPSGPNRSQLDNTAPVTPANVTDPSGGATQPTVVAGNNSPTYTAGDTSGGGTSGGGTSA